MLLILYTLLLSMLFRGRSRKVHEASDSTDAQKKFGDAKSISSDQYFGDRDPDVSGIFVYWATLLILLTVLLFCGGESSRVPHTSWKWKVVEFNKGIFQSCRPTHGNLWKSHGIPPIIMEFF